MEKYSPWIKNVSDQNNKKGKRGLLKILLCFRMLLKYPSVSNIGPMPAGILWIKNFIELRRLTLDVGCKAEASICLVHFQAFNQWWNPRKTQKSQGESQKIRNWQVFLWNLFSVFETLLEKLTSGCLGILPTLKKSCRNKPFFKSLHRVFEWLWRVPELIANASSSSSFHLPARLHSFSHSNSYFRHFSKLLSSWTEKAECYRNVAMAYDLCSDPCFVKLTENKKIKRIDASIGISLFCLVRTSGDGED